MDRLSKKALEKLGRERWQESVLEVVALLHQIFWPDRFILGGGNARLLDPAPDGCERGENEDAFRGALRLWPGEEMLAEPQPSTYRIVRTAPVCDGRGSSAAARTPQLIGCTL